MVASYKFSCITFLLTSGLALSWRLFWMGPLRTSSSWLIFVQGLKKMCVGVLGRTRKFTFKVELSIGRLAEDFVEE